jgi:tetratricopeptide (TPR) repeat protein
MQSSPTKAEIYAARLGAEKPQLVGETPLTLSSADLNKKYKGSGPMLIEYRKEGYQTQSTIVTDLGAFNLTISLELPPSSGLEDQEKLNRLIDLVFESQRLARAGRFDASLEKLKQAETMAPQISAAFELEGGIYYLQKQYPKALDAYRTVAKLDPQNTEAIRMRNLLEAQLGVKPGRAISSEAATGADKAAPPAAGGATK